MSDLRERVQERLNVLGINPFEAARRANLERGYVNDILQGKKKTVRGPYLVALAEVLACDIEYLLGARDTPRPFRVVDRRSPGYLKVAGTVEAGVYRDAAAAIAEERVGLPADPEFPQDAQLAYRVAGDSMNLRGVEPGMILACVKTEAWTSIKGRLRDGLLVIVRRSMGGEADETTCKEFRRAEDGAVELVPRSTNPKHLPILVPPSTDGIEIEAVVLAATRLLADF